MAEIRVHELAKELKKSNSEIIEICAKKGTPDLDKQSSMTEKLANEVRAHVEKMASEKKEAAPAKKKMHLVFHPEHSSNKQLTSRKKPAGKPAPKQEEKAVKPEVKAETKAEPKPEIKAEAKPEVKTEARPEIKAEAKAEPKPEIKAEVKLEIKAEAKPEPKPVQEKPVEKVLPKASEKKEEPAAAKPEQEKVVDEKAGILKEKGDQEEALNMQTPEKKTTENSMMTGRQGDRSQSRREDGQGGYQRREGAPRRDGQGRRDGQNNRREDGQGGYQRREDGQGRRDGQGFQKREDGGFQRREDGQGRRDGQGFQRREDGQGFAKREDFGKKDQDFGARRNDSKDRERGGNRFGGGMESLTPALTKSEARGGKGLNKKEREMREKSKQNADKTGRFDENTKNISKLKGPAKKNEQPAAPEKKEEEVIKTLILPETITISELAEKMKLTAAVLIKAQFMKGNMLTLNAEISYDQAEEIALDYNFICEPEEKIDVIEELLKEEEESEDVMVPRPPVVCVMGHVDHGKTSLLDAIRSTSVTAREAGGITQHIGAYTVKCNGEDITFLDTPGHEAFTAMRMRGAQATDIAVLVVAADDGVMPQTIEAINHARAAGVEIIVAINKIDKPSANVDRVMKELSEHELISEEWGGQTIFAQVSAKNHEGIENLLEMILLAAEMKELKANPNRRARGLVIEAQLDKGRGPVATILIQKGTLHVGDTIAVGSCYGKVRAMVDDKGRRVKEAKPSVPVEILGLNDVPNAGEIMVATENEKEARNFAETFIKENREKMLADTKTKLTLDSLNSQIQEGNLKELNIIIKADVQGSVEAVKQSLLKLSNEEVVVRVIHGGVGAISESDVTLASASNAIIIGFNVRPDTMAKSVAEREQVELRLYRVIYQAIDDIEAAMKGMLDPVYEEKIIGHAQVRQIFKASGVGNIAGSYVTDGVFQRGCKIRIHRDNELIYEGALASLKRFKDDVKEVKEGYECGLVFEKFNDIKEEDVVEAYIMVEVPR